MYGQPEFHQYIRNVFKYSFKSWKIIRHYINVNTVELLQCVHLIFYFEKNAKKKIFSGRDDFEQKMIFPQDDSIRHLCTMFCMKINQEVSHYWLL